MGTVVAQDIFQSKLDAIFIGMEGVTGIADDMIIAGKDEMEHDRNFLAFMEKCMENNLSSSSSMNFAAYDHRQNKGKSNKPKHTSGKNVGQNNSRVQTSSNNNHPSRKPPGMEKIQFKQIQVSFYGHIWSKHGISPDPKKIQALKHMEFPPDKEIMRSFLGMINYLNRYSALSTHLAAPLSILTHQATDYKPGKVHLENFQ